MLEVLIVISLLKVFVPMFGDSFFHKFTIGMNDKDLHKVFVPMFGDSFFHILCKYESIRES